MRILTAVFDLGPGGTQRAAQNYSIAYKQAGYDVAVLSYDGGGRRADTLSTAGIDVFAGNADPASREKALEAALRWTPDVLHIHREGRPDERSGAILQRFKQARGDRLAILETNVFGRVDYTPVCRLIDVHLHLSQWCLWKWNQWKRLTCPGALGVVVPYSAMPDQFRPVSNEARRTFRAQHRIPEHAFVFGRIGQPSYWKWHPIIFDAFRIVAQQHDHVYLLLVGMPEKLRPHLDKLPITVRSRIREIPFLQGDEALQTCYGSLDAFLHASLIGESFGMVLAEAMLCECPVITLSTPTKDNSQLEVVGHKVGGLVVADLDHMVQAMQRLITTPAQGQHLGKQGRQRIVHRYAPEPVLHRLLPVVEAVHTTASRDELVQRLVQHPDVLTDASPETIQHLLHHSMGSPSFKDRMLMRLVHHPFLFRIWHELKHA